MIKNIFKYICLFLVGGLCYYMIEIAARGFSHWTMIVVGGICFILVGLLNEHTKKMAITKQMVISCIIITIVEFFSGCIINLWFHLNIWDYSDEPFNILGQICLSHTIYWFLLSFIAILVDDYIRYWIFGEEKPKYTVF